jgi:single-stranded DNA-binding protein
MNLGAMKVQLLNCRVAGTPTFMPGSEPKRNHTMLTVICNRGKKPNTQEEMSDEITLNFWGKYADFGAKYLDVGREVNIDGELRSHRHMTGQINPTTKKPIIERRVEVLVNRCYFGKDSMKELSARVNSNIAIAKSQGRINVEAVLTAEELLKVERPDVGDYNPAIHDVAGRYGNAKIWKKGTGMLAQTAVAAAVGPESVADLNVKMVEIQKALDAAAGAEANPFTPAT